MAVVCVVLVRMDARLVADFERLWLVMVPVKKSPIDPGRPLNIPRGKASKLKSEAFDFDVGVPGTEYLLPVLNWNNPNWWTVVKRELQERQVS